MNSISRRQPSFIVSLIPLVVLIAGLISIVVFLGADAVQRISHGVLLIAAAVSTGIALLYCRRPIERW